MAEKRKSGFEVFAFGKFANEVTVIKAKKSGQIVGASSSIVWWTAGREKGDDPVAHFMNFTGWGEIGNEMMKFEKGDQVAIEGFCIQDRWEDKSGKRSAHKMVVTKFKAKRVENKQTRPRDNGGSSSSNSSSNSSNSSSSQPSDRKTGMDDIDWDDENG